ncbi:MFS transporter [Natronocalculus amylovorans]|uniref:MFS transporter n=1 Tax=Natronocalculus amylovorans TaxID=2917812 RepID=A0AAE3FWD6_9EURY|nr:MFS transporter [Natronocalculus amylovorans]MCL9815869.1 MFS transporter [Natronocalculus amylovorans]
MATWRLVSMILFWQVAASIIYYSVFAATPFFRDEFQLSGFAVGLVVTSLTLGYAVFLLPLGAMTDRFGERRTLTVGILGLSVGALLVTVAWSYPALLLAAFLLGSLYGTAMPGTNKAIFDNVAAGRQNLAMGIKQVGVTAGSGISALLVTWIAGILFWQAGFITAAIFGLLAAVLFFGFYRDGGGSGAASYPDFGGLARNKPYRSLTIAGFFLGAGLFTTTGYTILFIDESIGATVAYGGVVLALLQVSGSVGRVLTGWLSDVLPGEPRKSIGAILLIQTIAGVILFVVVAFSDTVLTATAALIGLGFFVLGFTGVYYSCMATLVGPDEMGSATGGGQLSLTSGALVAPPAFGYLADIYGYQASWLLLAGFGCLAIGFIIYVIRTEPPVTRTAAAVE